MDLMRKLMLMAGLVASLGVAGTADMAGARTYHHYYGADRHNCRYERHRNGVFGAIAGTIGGGLIGSSLSHGRAGGTLLGAGGGALAGSAIARNATRC
jgi:hypothetical protein